MEKEEKQRDVNLPVFCMEKMTLKRLFFLIAEREKNFEFSLRSQSGKKFFIRPRNPVSGVFCLRTYPNCHFRTILQTPTNFFYLKNVYFQKKKISIRETKNF